MASQVLFVILDIPSKGKGVVATQDISPGTLLLEEKPLISINKAIALASDIAEAFNTLSQQQQKDAFMRLASAHGQDPARHPYAGSLEFSEEHRGRRRRQEYANARIAEEKSLLSIYITNAIAIGDSTTSSAVFESISRFNHECVPNACFSWDEDKEVESVYAISEIKAGEVCFVRSNLSLELVKPNC